jgi:PleD family two-component response regulator
VDNAINISLTMGGAGVGYGYGGDGDPMKLEGFVDMTRCLLIDQDGASQRNLLAMLDALGIDTARASAADEALKFCNDNAPEVVMVAAAAPGVQPHELMKRLKRSGKGRPPVVFLYAETPDTDVIGQSIIEGAADVLMTPLDRDILEFKLRQAGIIA